MKNRLVLPIAVTILVVLVLGVMPRFAPAQASGSLQAAATATATPGGPTATAAPATATAVPPTATATAVPPTATAVPPTATATGVPLAAYPAPVTSAIATRVGGKLMFRWSVMTQKGVKGFNLYAGKNKLNARLIKTHKSLSYHKTVSYRPGKPSIRVLLRSGGYVSVLLP